MDLKPSAFEPSACIPHIPNSDLIEQLKIYGDALVTVSVDKFTVVPDGFGRASPGDTGTSYLNPVTPLSFVAVTSVTLKVPLYLSSVTLLMITSVSMLRPKIGVAN